MKNTLAVFALLLALFVGNSLHAEQAPMKCETGPVKKEYGKTNWLVYSCTDNKTLVIVSDTGNPAMPFYFTFFLKNGSYNLTGEGTGSKEATGPAFKDLSQLKDKDISALINETKNVK